MNYAGYEFSNPSQFSYYQAVSKEGIEDLRKLKSAWIQEADQQGIPKLCRHIGVQCGTEQPEILKPTTGQHKFGHPPITISVSAKNLEVKHDEKVVCKVTEDGTILFVPGDWLERLIGEEEEADKNEQARSKSTVKKEYQELFDELGLKKLG